MAKHCKLCSHCCNNFDHHCLWLKTCIGANNHQMFVIFLFLLALDNFLFVRGGCSSKYNCMANRVSNKIQYSAQQLASTFLGHVYTATVHSNPV